MDIRRSVPIFAPFCIGRPLGVIGEGQDIPKSEPEIAIKR